MNLTQQAIRLNTYRSHETDRILSLDQLLALLITRLGTATGAERDELMRQIEGPLADYIKTLPVKTRGMFRDLGRELYHKARTS